MEALIRQVAISALLILVAVLVFIPISPVGTAAPTFTYHTWTGHTWTGAPRVSTTVTVPHTHTRWTDPSPPYSWPPPGYYPPSAAYCDPNDPSSYCWDPQCAPQCGYEAVVTESGTTMVTSVVAALPSTVVTTQLQTVVFTQPPTQTVTGTQTPDYTPIAIAIVATAVIVGLLMNRRIGRSPTSTTQPGARAFCKSCGKQIPANSQFCQFCGSAQ